MSLFYLAYGSNLHPQRLRRRIPGARFIDTTKLEGYALAFHKRSPDGSGKCSIKPSTTETVYGAIYQMGVSDQVRLDEIEGVGDGYHRIKLQLRFQGPARPVFLYIAEESFIDNSLLPYDWYHAYVLRGARHHGFPTNYITMIEQSPNLRDPDSRRRQTELDRLAQMGHAT